MNKLLRIHLILLFVALFITFALYPFDQIYFKSVPKPEIEQYYTDALNFNFSKAWKIFITWFVGLSCGRLMIRALTRVES